MNVAIGNAFDLNAFESAIQLDPDVTGVLYSGSLGRGSADRYSDLDIELWVTDRAFEDAPVSLRRFMTYLGPVRFMYERGEAFTTGFVGSDWQRVDLVLHRETETQPQSKYSNARVVKDVDGALATMVASPPAEIVAATWDGARAAIEEAIDSQIYLALHNARGAVWSAMGEVSYHAGELYILLALLRGHQSFGFRYVERLLSPAESELLTAAWPKEPDFNEVRRAGRALWRWTRYVWDEAEAFLGRRLAVSIDETELLAAVDRIYSADSSQF